MEMKERPISVIASVTLGKEIHAGHALLLATADLVRRGLGSTEPLNIIDNNTGPRAAGALVSFTQRTGLSLEDAAGILTEGVVPPEEVINAYRNRIESGDDFNRAFKMLDLGGFNIFQSVATKVQQGLEEAGFKVDIVPETQFISLEEQVLTAVNPLWYGSGFNFLSSDKGIRVLQKAGQLTATGKGLLSMFGASKDEKRLVVFVDGSPDTGSAVLALNAVFGRAIQLPGAAIGFGGKMASGTKGEALTLSEMINAFKEQHPPEFLSKSLRQMVLTKSLTMRTANLADAFYDFEDNDDFMRSLICCLEEARRFEDKVELTLTDLESRVGGETTAADHRTEMFLQHLSQRQEAILRASPEDILASMKKTSKFGRGNFFFGFLQRLLLYDLEKVTSLTRSDCDMLQQMIRYSMERLGYETK